VHTGPEVGVSSEVEDSVGDVDFHNRTIEHHQSTHPMRMHISCRSDFIIAPARDVEKLPKIASVADDGGLEALLYLGR